MIGTRLLLTLLLAISLNSWSQKTESALWTKAPLAKAFVENRGQYDRIDADHRILYGASDGWPLFFTERGFIHYLSKSEECNTESSGASNEKKYEKRNRKHEIYPVEMEFVGINPGMKVIALDTLLAYWNFPDPSDPTKDIQKIKGFQRLVYKDLYPGINLEYTFHPETGFKYAFTVKPGADPSLIKMQYNNAVSVSAVNGNIVVHTVCGKLVDHDPISFYTDSNFPVVSSFVLKDNVVSFTFENLDPSRSLTIDPWINTTVTPKYTPLEMGVDSLNNVYVYGMLGGQYSPNSFPQYLQKFNSSGVLQWTTNVNFGSFNSFTGDLAVDPSGYCYLTNGFDNFIYYCVVAKLNSSGALIYGNGNDPYLYENWRLAFNCDFTQLVQLGNGPGCCEYAGGTVVDVSNGTQLTPFFPANTGDFSCATFGKNGKLYAMSTVDAVTNGPSRVQCLDPSNNFSLVFNVPAGYYRSDTSDQDYGPQGYNGIAASCRYLYTSFNGLYLEKRDLNNGAILDSLLVPGALIYKCSGLAVDPSGNIYVGSNNGVYAYDELLNFLAFYPTPYAVTEIIFGNDGHFYACGGNPNPFSDPNQSTCFVGKFNAITFSSSGITSTTTPTNCLTNDGSASVTPVFCYGSYSYIWNTSPNQTQQTATGLSPGVYSVIVTDNASCNLTLVHEVVIGGILNLSMTATNITCNAGSDGSATVTVLNGNSPYTYSWSNGQTSSTITGLTAGNYYVLVTDSGGCRGLQQVTITDPEPLFLNYTITNGCQALNVTATLTGGNPPYSYSWSNGQTTQTATGIVTPFHTLYVTDSAGCLDTFSVSVIHPTPPALTVNMGAIHPRCGSTTNGYTDASPNGGTLPYSYSWNTGATNQSLTGLGAGTYSVIVTDAVGCTVTGSVTLTPLPPLAISPNVVNASSCSTCNGSVSVSILSGAPPYNYSWSSGQLSSQANNLCPGQYVVYVSDNNSCLVIDTVFVSCPGFVSDITDIGSFVTIYPNPSPGIFNLVFSKRCPESSIVIYNSLGEIIFRKQYYLKNNSESLIIDLSREGQGCYYILLQNEEILSGGKLVISR